MSTEYQQPSKDFVAKPSPPYDHEPNGVFTESNRRTEIFLPHVVLDTEREPIQLFISLEKQTTPIREEQLIEEELPELREMFESARELRGIPERERPRELLKLLRSKVAYSYESTLSELEKTDPNRVTAIKKNNGKPFTNLALLRESVHLGYANCHPLANAMLFLAKQAGLEGAYLTNAPNVGKTGGEDPNPIKNIIRRDTNQGLFKSYNTGVNVPEGHAWVELRTSVGEWIPVDPATELVGDNEEGLAIFNEAHYRALVALKLNVSPLPEGVRHFGMRDLEFLPGEPQHTGVLQINAYAKHEAEFETGHYEGSLNIEMNRYDLPPAMGVNYTVKSVQVSGNE